jgi:hypothetical protein
VPDYELELTTAASNHRFGSTAGSLVAARRRLPHFAGRFRFDNHEVPAMRQNPIAMIEFVAFIGLVIWLFFWQHKSSMADRTRDEQTQHPAEPGETRASSPDEAGSRPPSGDAQ